MEKIWLKNYAEGVAQSIDPEAYQSITDLFDQNCAKYRGQVAFTNYGFEITYGELEKYSRYFAGYLQNVLKVQRGTRVALMLPNILQYPVAMYGILRAGCIVVNVNPLYTPKELKHQLSDSGAEVILVMENFASVLEQTLDKTQIKYVIVTEMGDLFGFVKSKVFNYVIKRVKKLVPKWNIEHAVHLNKVLSRGKRAGFQHVDVKTNDIAFLQYTGGTTGVAKGAILTHRNLVSNLQQCYQLTKSMLEDGKEVCITALPLYHIFSLTICCLLILKIGANSVLITNPRDIPRFIEDISKLPFSIFIGVNTLFNALINRKNFQELDFTHLKVSIGGGMAVQNAVSEKWLAFTNSNIIQGYGLTEASPVVSMNGNPKMLFNGSIGLPVSSTDVTIRDEQGHEVEQGHEGELWVQGPQVMRGYWNHEEETRATITPEGWLKTGDIVYMDKEGYLYLVDRIKDIIVVGGYNVYPTELEDVIASVPGVAEVGVIGVPHRKMGETIKAFIVKKDPNLTEADILTHCSKRLTDYKMPKIIEFMDELPKTNVGKILRRQLREERKTHRAETKEKKESKKPKK